MQRQHHWFLFDQNGIVVCKNSRGQWGIPCSFHSPCPPVGTCFNLGLLRGRPCTACRVHFTDNVPGLASITRREAFELLEQELQDKAIKGAELVHWDEHSRFCPRCGGVTIFDYPGSKCCANCGYMLFPNPVPAVLALVHKDDSVLLVHSHSFNGPFYSCVAGYVDAGESLEDCVRREVLEETGITVEDVCYFGSQPWPFPNTLMVAFTARYKQGAITLQEEELSDGGFFLKTALPELPPRYSLARNLIDAWIENS